MHTSCVVYVFFFIERVFRAHFNRPHTTIYWYNRFGLPLEWLMAASEHKEGRWRKRSPNRKNTHVVFLGYHQYVGLCCNYHLIRFRNPKWSSTNEYFLDNFTTERERTETREGKTITKTTRGQCLFSAVMLSGERQRAIQFARLEIIDGRPEWHHVFRAAAAGQLAFVRSCSSFT